MLLFHELEGFLDQKRRDLLKMIDSFREDELHLKEYEGGWTVPEIVEHLYYVESNILRKVDQMLQSHPVEAPEPLLEKVVDIMPLFQSKGLIGTKKKAPKDVEPTGKIPLQESLLKLESVRGQLKNFLPHLEKRATNGMVAPVRPPVGVDSNVCQWIHFAAVHEWAHINQIKRIRRSKSFDNGFK